MLSRIPSSAFLLFAATLPGLILLGCDGQGSHSVTAIPDDFDPGEPVEGDWIMGRLGSEMEHLNPYTSPDAASSSFNNLIFDSLLDMDNETLELEPSLAQSWEISDDKLTYTFHLRDDVLFSDGEPFTAHDVKFSFDTVKDPTTDAPNLRNYFQDFVECEVLDDYTVQFTAERPYFRHEVVLGTTLRIIPKHIYGEGDFNTHPNNRNPIGSGPYVLDRWDTGQRVEMSRNELYWGDKPYLKRRISLIITNDTAAFQVFRRGEMDFMTLSPEQWVNQASRPDFEARFNKFEYYRPSYNYIGWNMRRPLFEDRRVRRALTMLLDREEILEEIYYGLAQITTGNFFPDEPEYNHDVEPWPFDPEQAQALLDEAGWTGRNSDGIRMNDEGLTFDFEMLIVNDSVIAEQIATLFQEELRRAGIRMRIRQLEWATFLESVKAHQYDACQLGWSLAAYPDPYQVWHSSQAVVNGSNAVGFIHEEADRIMEEARLEFDHDKRIEMYHRFHEILHEEQPYTFMFCSMALLAVDKRFQNIEVYPFGPDPLEWWVPADLQRYP